MKQRLYYLIPVILLTTLFACSKGSSTSGYTPPPTTGGNDTTMKPPADTAAANGKFMDGAHTTSGTATIDSESGTTTLTFTNFSTDNGPDLKVYLSTDKIASSFVNLGDLKAITGSQSYPIGSSVDVSKYHYVLIWCQQFSVLFGYAKIN